MYIFDVALWNLDWYGQRGPVMPTEANEFSRVHLLDWAENNLAFYRLPLARISTVFLKQAYVLEVNRIFDAFDLVQPIKVLEGLADHDNTPPPDKFKDSILLGLHKKHFTSPRFIARNLRNFLESKFGGEYFDKVFFDASKLSGSGYVDKFFINYLSHHITIPPLALRDHESRLTGEWVVFYPHATGNFYLCLGSHESPGGQLAANRYIREMVDLACELDNWPFCMPAP